MDRLGRYSLVAALETIEADIRDATGLGEGRALGLAEYATAVLHNGLGRVPRERIGPSASWRCQPHWPVRVRPPNRCTGRLPSGSRAPRSFRSWAAPTSSAASGCGLTDAVITAEPA